MKYWILFLLIGISAFSCRHQSSADNFKDCPSGKPEAIFSKDIAPIQRHQFQIRRQEAIETIVFESGKKLTIIQTGCDSIRQEFRFEFPDKIEGNQPAAYWVDQAVREFEFLSSLGPQYLVFSSWAQAISNNSNAIHLSESTEIQPGFFVRIDRITGSDHTILTVILSEGP